MCPDGQSRLLGAFDPETGRRMMPDPDGQLVEATGAFRVPEGDA